MFFDIITKRTLKTSGFSGFSLRPLSSVKFRQVRFLTLDSKSSKPLTGPVGSNPTFSATSPQATYRLRRLFYKSHRRAHSATSPFTKKVTLHLCCSLVNALATFQLATNLFRGREGNFKRFPIILFYVSNADIKNEIVQM